MQSEKRTSYKKPLQQPPPQQQFAIDAVLIDFNMPRMNGPDTIMEMRKIGFRGPIIGVSGGEEETMKQFLQAGADEVLQKPAKTDQLVGMLLRGFELVVRDETRGQDDNSLTKTIGSSTEISLITSDDGTDNKSPGGSDDGMDHQAPMSENEIARQEHLAHLRRFVVESLAAMGKK